MNKHSKIYVAGHKGLVGSAIYRRLKSAGYTNILTRTSAMLDLRNSAEVDRFFAVEKPDYVYLAAAKVGGIHANATFPAEFIRDNLAIQSNVIHSAYSHGVQRLMFLGSSCIYPKLAPQPIQEEYLLTGSLEPTNEPYAIAKIAGLKMCEAYNRQYGTQYLSVMPTNIYGPNDNFDMHTSHVLPALIRKFHEAKVSGSSTVQLWGTGSPRREFLYSDDLADACVFLMENHSSLAGTELLNIGVGEDVTILELAQMIKEIVGYSGEIVFDSSKPDGAPRKLLDVTKLSALGWTAKTNLREGTQQTYDWFVERTRIGQGVRL